MFSGVHVHSKIYAVRADADTSHSLELHFIKRPGQILLEFVNAVIVYDSFIDWRHSVFDSPAEPALLISPGLTATPSVSRYAATLDLH